MKGLQSRPSLTPFFAGFLSSISSRPDSFCLIESACSYPASINLNHKNEQLPVSLGVLFLKTLETASKPPCWSFLLLLSLLLLLCVLSLEDSGLNGHLITGLSLAQMVKLVSVSTPQTPLENLPMFFWLCNSTHSPLQNSCELPAGSSQSYSPSCLGHTEGIPPLFGIAEASICLFRR